MIEISSVFVGRHQIPCLIKSGTLLRIFKRDEVRVLTLNGVEVAHIVPSEDFDSGFVIRCFPLSSGFTVVIRGKKVIRKQSFEFIPSESYITYDGDTIELSEDKGIKALFTGVQLSAEKLKSNAFENRHLASALTAFNLVNNLNPISRVIFNAMLDCADNEKVKV